MWGWQVASTTVSLILAALTLWIVLVNRKQVEASQEQVRVSREQVTATQAQVKVSQDQIQQALDVQYDSQRPLLIPDGVLPIKDASSNLTIEDQHPWLDFGPQECTVTLRNLGPGIALNVWGVILGPQPAAQTNEYPERYSLQIVPMLPISRPQLVKATIGGPMMGGEATIGGNTLYAPPVPPAADRWQKGSPVAVARLTLTYHDVFGHKHATIFDYMAWRQWRYVAFLRDVPKDLEDRHVEAIGQGVFQQ